MVLDLSIPPPVKHLRGTRIKEVWNHDLQTPMFCNVRKDNLLTYLEKVDPPTPHALFRRVREALPEAPVSLLHERLVPLLVDLLQELVAAALDGLEQPHVDLGDEVRQTVGRGVKHGCGVDVRAVARPDELVGPTGTLGAVVVRFARDAV